MLSQWDAASQFTHESTASDSIINSQRDGENQSYYIQFDGTDEQGSFDLIVGTPDGTTVDVPITVPGVGQFQPFDEGTVLLNIENGLDAALGPYWPSRLAWAMT